MLHDAMVALFAMSAGFCASGIISNLYRILFKKSDSAAGKVGHFVVMVVAGPSVLIDNAARSWRKKGCTATAFWLAFAWSR
jgi:hypothetical protein